MIPGSANPLLLASAAAGGYQVSRSLRFNSSDSAYLSRTPAVAGSSTWTFSCWAKIGTIENTFKKIFGLNENNGIIINNNQIRLNDDTYNDDTIAYYRDPSAWYHIVVRSNGSANTVWVNNVQQALATTSCVAGLGINGTGAHRIGKQDSGSVGARSGFNGYLADIHFIDGQALTPSSFTEVSATTGQLIPLAYSGSYGTNGFKLKFSDNSAATAATLGADTSGNGNNWTPNNLSVTAGAGNDSLVDTPTSYGTDTGVGGEVRGNYCVINPLSIPLNTPTISNGNLDLTNTGPFNQSKLGTMALPSSGKWYWEILCQSGGSGVWLLGIGNSDETNGNSGRLFYLSDARKFDNSSFSGYGSTYTVGDVIGVAVDMDAATLTFYKNGVSQGVAFSNITTTLTKGIVPQFQLELSGRSMSFNAGQRAFAYPLNGFKVLCDTNLPAPLVAKPNTLMDVLTWSGNNASPRSFTGLNFSPDFVWIKSRSDAAGHGLYDSVRLAGNVLRSMDTSAEVANSAFGYLSGFNSDGFALTAGTYPGYESGDTNMTGRTYVGWAWDAGTSTVSNTAGSITSQVRANASAGFSVVSFTTQSSSTATVGHGLNVAPTFIIQKIRTLSADWYCYHTSIGAGNIIQLNTTAASSANSTIWNNTAPTSTVWTLGNGWAGSYSTIAYCFAPVVGYSNAFSYTGNGDSSGPFVYLGFRPRFIIQKRTDSAGSWLMIDTARDPVNVARNELFANSSAAEYDNTSLIDVLSNGFKIRATFANMNASGGSFIGYAFAENPFQYARAR